MTRPGEDPQTEDALIGARFGPEDRIEVQRKIATGGIGVVYEAYDHGKARRVAMKFLRTDHAIPRELVQRFEREGRSLARLRHPNVVSVYGLGRKTGLTFIVSEFVDGPTLGQLLDEGALGVDRALDTCREIARGLGAAHAAGIVHRDMKPENVMIAADGAVKVLDFGIAKVLDSSSVHSQQGVFLGTPGYAAPEQIKGADVDGRADVFSLGAMLYEMLTGRIAFRGRHTVQVLRSTVERDPIPPGRFNDAVTRPVARLISRMIQKSRRRRPSDMDEVIRSIDEIRDGLPGGGPGERRGLRALLRRTFER